MSSEEEQAMSAEGQYDPMGGHETMKAFGCKDGRSLPPLQVTGRRIVDLLSAG